MEISDNAFHLYTLYMEYNLNINHDNGGISRWILYIDVLMTKKSFYT